MQSMTGYGKAEYNKDGISLVIEMKTVNNRYLDIVPKYPKVFLKFDDLIRKTVSNHISRGRIELFITLRDLREQGKEFTVDLGVARGYYSAIKSLAQTFPDLENDFKLTSLAKVSDVIVQQNEADDSIYEGILASTLENALKNLKQMRKAEGEKLKADLVARMTTIKEIVAGIEDRAPLIAEQYKAKLTEKVSDALSGADLDEARLLQEVVVFADKSNIDEEITRLKSHISQFYTIIAGENCGRKLDFLVQEFNREANTICSKSNDISITDLALKLKYEIEKVREQIQNVE